MEIEKQVCSIDQMEESGKLGFDITKASMTWIKYFKDDEWALTIHHNEEELRAVAVIPTFSVSDILEMLPKKIYDKVYEYEYVLFIVKYDYDWGIDYRCEDYYCMREVHSQNLRDALVAELKLLKENKEI